MKKAKWIYGFAALLLMGSAAVLRADDMGKGDDPAGPGMEDSMDGGQGGHGDRLKKKLGLSDDQAAKVKDLFKKNMENMKPLRDQVKIDIDTLQQKVDIKASDSDIKKLLETLSADREKMQAGRKKIEAELKEILSPTQQAKMALGMRRMGRHMMGKGKWQHKGDKGKKKDKDGAANSAPSGKDNGGDGN